MIYKYRLFSTFSIEFTVGLGSKTNSDQKNDEERKMEKLDEVLN